MTTTDYRYGLHSKYGKGYCPSCGRKSYVPYIDKRTNELAPEEFGRCDHQTSCGHILSPYTKGQGRQSYADEVYDQERQQWQQDNRYPIDGPNRQRSTGPRTPVAPPEPRPVILQTMPQDVFTRSLSGYESNNFAKLLMSHFGSEVATSLIDRFKLGTYKADYELAYWTDKRYITQSFGKGGAIFWMLDANGQVYGGQGVLFDENGATVKFKTPTGDSDRCNRPISYLAKRYLKDRKMPIPDWLTRYETTENKFPYPFGLQQLATAPKGQSIAITESPKTAMLAAGYFPQLCWMAIWSLSYLNKDRLEPLRHRTIALFPDCSKDGKAFDVWKQKADELNANGFRIVVSDYLEKNTSDEQKAKGYDLADFILGEWKGYPPSWDRKPGQIPNCRLIPSLNRFYYAKITGISPDRVYSLAPICELNN
ncbi:MULTISPECIES: DUF6371 domain-containing protein [Larkinella]|jgi:hypothetical protein|uniref:Toprim domain-containing protein n=1 Tax=Larkinella humicola TaxID=2607654 RepID=A0A5N1JMR1_9BACT|nr:MULTISPECIES: DUF6371 domain-containing protein [Larkinella]KAA9356856.1 hypothetical protein F0P93_03695 [Larkinella humicola]